MAKRQKKLQLWDEYDTRSLNKGRKAGEIGSSRTVSASDDKPFEGIFETVSERIDRKRPVKGIHEIYPPRVTVPNGEGRGNSGGDESSPYRLPEISHEGHFDNRASEEADNRSGGGATGEQPDGGNAPNYEVSDDSEGYEYDFDAGISEFYDRLYNSLAGYGVTGIPTLDELYELLEAFLRPSIEAAIRDRQRRGETNMAELDADAYARGMGGSSYLSSMKAREYDDIESDIAVLESGYTSTVAEYLHNAVNEMRELESQLAAIAASTSASTSTSTSGGYSGGGRSSGSSSSQSSETDRTPYGHNNDGAYFDGEWYDGDFSYLESSMRYEDYANYLEGFTTSERYLIFTSNARRWRIIRWQMQYNLPQVEYMSLLNEYFVMLSGGGGGGGSKWLEMLY